MKTIILLTFLLLFTQSCKKEVPATVSNNNPNIEYVKEINYQNLGMTPTPGKIKISSNSCNFVYYGYDTDNNIWRNGDTTINISQSEWKDILSTFDLNNYFNLKDSYQVNYPYSNETTGGSFEILTNYRTKKVEIYQTDTFKTTGTWLLVNKIWDYENILIKK